MAELHHLTLRNTDGAGITTEVLLDNQPLKMVQAIDLHIDVDSLITATVTFCVTVDAETLVALESVDD